jgi:hypothetical protein
VLLPDFAQMLDQLEVPAQARLVEFNGARFLQSSAGSCATRSAVILPVSRPESMGE